MTKLLLASAICAAAAFHTMPAMAASMAYKGDISAQNEVPPTGTKGTGHLTATFDSSTKDFEYQIEYSGLSGPATMAHFHGPAPKGANADVMIPITGSLASPIKGKATLTDAQAKALADGHLYFNMHTEAHKPGEVRGQVEPGT